jgi:hypothetical protein
MSYNLGYDSAPTNKFQSERHIFDFNKMMVHIPSNRTSFPHSNKKTKDAPNSNRLETTSITPLDVVTLDTNNVLFISTLDSNWTRQNKSSVMMKRQTSHTPERPKSNYHHIRRYSQPERNDPIPAPYYDNKRNSFHNRRTSVQSDAASSTELIRRFSSESTTSSVVTHLSWVDEGKMVETSNYAQTVSDKYQQHPKQEVLSCTLSTNSTNAIMSLQSKQNKQDEHQNMCETVQHPLAIQPSTCTQKPAAPQPSTQKPAAPQSSTQKPAAPQSSTQKPAAPQSSTQKPSASQPSTQKPDAPPVWADPIKIKENPVRYEYTASYLSERAIPRDSMLPLPKPCVFHFSDSNTKQKTYGSMIRTLFECDTVCNFSARWRLFKKRVSQLETNQNIYCFVKGVEPMWEDEVNKKGGRLTLHHAMLDDLFEWLLFCLVGGGLQGAVGLVVSRRSRGDRIELWLDESASQVTLPDLK